jgi:hypothetical protein
MNNGHFSDDQIQEILDDMMHGANRPLSALGHDCANCRDRFEQYRQLYAGLAVDPGFSLPPGFADSVLQRMGASRPVFWARPVVWIPLAVGAFMLILAAMFIWIDLRPLGGQFLRLAADTAAAFRPLRSQFQQVLARLNGSADLFILGGLGLLGAAALDRILGRQALRRSH